MTVTILDGDAVARLRTLPDRSFQACVTSPPYYGLRDYGVAGQIGLEDTPDDYVARMVEVFREVRRVLRDDATPWLNIGDSYAGQRGGPTPGGFSNTASRQRDRARVPRPSHLVSGLKPKDLLGIPWMLAFALRADGWYLRKDIIWHKPNPMPESVRDRPTSAHEHVFLLSKRESYFYDAAAIREEQIYVGLKGQDESGFKNPAGYAGKHAAGYRSSEPRKKRGVPPHHAQYASSDQSGLDAVGRGEGRNARDVWTIATRPFSGAHFATMPPELAERCIKAGSRKGDAILDPFGGAGTTGLAADRLQRHATLIELNPAYAQLARNRITGDAPLLHAPAAE